MCKEKIGAPQLDSQIIKLRKELLRKFYVLLFIPLWLFAQII